MGLAQGETLWTIIPAFSRIVTPFFVPKWYVLEIGYKASGR